MPFKVVVWGTGNVGRPALRTVMANPALELVGVIVSDPAKVGLDAGALCGLPVTGILATDDVDAGLAIEADAVVYAATADTRPVEAAEDLLHALRSGRNVVSTSFYNLLHPDCTQPAFRARFEEACAEGGSSCFVSGIDPGFVGDVLAVFLTGCCEEVREVRVFEIFDYATYHAPFSVLELCGFGKPLDRTPPMLLPGVPEMVWGGTIRLIAQALGVTLDGMRQHVEELPLDRTIELPIGTLEAGTRGAFRFQLEGLVDNHPLIVVDHITRITPDIAPHWPPCEGGGLHGVRITGRPTIELKLSCEDEDGDHNVGGVNASAARIVNAIPLVAAAKPGLVTALDVPFVPGAGLARTRSSPNLGVS